MTYDPENKALEALETERDNLRVELAAARRVIAAGYGTCSSCKWWDRNPPSGTYDTGWGECRRHDGTPTDFQLADGTRAPERVAAAWATGFEVDEDGFATTPDFGCVSHVKAPAPALSLPPLEIGEAKPTSSSLIVTEHPFPIVHSNHIPSEDP